MLKELPRNIQELINLRHLDNTHCYDLSHMPSGLGQISCLQTLPLFIVSKDAPFISRHIGGLGILDKLNSLREALEIIDLGRVKDANLECKAVNLRGKQHLKKLRLFWYLKDNINNEDEKSLEALQPHQNPKYLEVHSYGVRYFQVGFLYHKSSCSSAFLCLNFPI